MDELLDEFGVEAVIAPTDVRKEAEVAAMVEAAVQAFGGLDVIVNSVGLARGNDVEGLSTEEFRLKMDTNLDGTFFVTRATLPHLKESKGNLILMSSFAGNYPYPRNLVLWRHTMVDSGDSPGAWKCRSVPTASP